MIIRRTIPASPRGARSTRGLVVVFVGLVFTGVCFSQSSPTAATKPDATVSDTRLGLENLELLQKGINPGGAQGASLTPDQLVVTPELLNATPVPELPEKKDQDESTLRELRRQQWRSENWLVEGMRRSELAQNEADLAEDTLKNQSAARSRSAEDTSAQARVEAGTSNEWLALAVETQQAGETDAESRNASGPRAEPGAPASPSNAEGANPLGDFMAGWLSGDSRVLLASTTERSPNAIGSLPTGAGEGGRIDELSLAQTQGPESRSTGLVPVANVGDAAASNPFLAFRDVEAGPDLRDFPSALERLAPDVPVRDQAFQLDTMMPVDAAPAQGNAAVAPIEHSGEKPSEPWRPPARDDEKYFPRLKRF